MQRCKRYPKKPGHGPLNGSTCQACKTLRQGQRKDRIAKQRCTANNSCPNDPEVGRTRCAKHANKSTKSDARRSELASKEQAPGNAPPHRLLSWDTVLWVTAPDNPPFHQSNTLAIQFFPDDRAVLGNDAWLKEAAKSDLGKAVLVPCDDGFYIHQGLATISAVKSQASFSVLIKTWDWFEKQLRTRLLLDTCRNDNGEARNTVIFLHWTTEEPKGMSLNDAYAEIRMLNHIHGAKIRPYPSESESWQERFKIGDIRAFEEEARSGPPEYSYRPKTCYGHGPCQLLEHETSVHKRTHSGSAKHVKVLGRKDRGELTCTLGPSKENQKKTSPKGQPYWFHQEYVPDLHDGEFRVVIATRPDASGIRGRKGYIVKVAKTAWIRDTRELASKAAEEEDFEPREYGDLSLSVIGHFALYLFKRLRNRADSLIYFKSLKVAVRLDVGISTDTRGERRLFYNELTRWPGAYYFSHTIYPDPKTQVFRAITAAFCNYIEHAMLETS
ncbi:hypothetical protein BDV96DRAFT_592861 [Lophiotrema nucula]|uniref:Uncharacterized protein n=1 Tax=Lophiotrema nucula TaxID=690887 RepID=A0A6A5YEU2_9PLEO|nr:hypothetical protein BDV96DRAFT_592861 [Lophiotrema nucula]